MTSRTLTVTSGPGDAGERLDRFLASRLPELSRARLQELLRAGEVTRDGGVITNPSGRVKSGQSYAVHVPAPRPATPEPQALPLDVLFEDEHLLVVDKPAGMVVHPAPGHPQGTLVNALLAHCAGSLSGIGGVSRPGIVHRIDREVSGLLVVAKHDRAHVGLAAQFSVHRTERAYEAAVWGLPAQLEGTVDRPIGRHPRDRKRMAVVSGGKRAVTHYRLLESFGTETARMTLSLETGRTHQIRVHLAALGLGIIGDRLYRPRRRPTIGPELAGFLVAFDRIALHARTLGFEHPMTRAHVRFEREPPACFNRLYEKLRGEIACSSTVKTRGDTLTA